MALLSWFETMGASDCFSGHTTWNDMTNYIKHSACTDFTIHSTCTDTGQAFRFTQAGTTSKSYGGASTGDDREIFANDTDDYPVIKLLGDSDAEIQVELGDFFWFYENALKTIRFSRESNDCQIKGGDNTIRDLSLWANTIDPYPYIKLTGSGDIDFHYNTARDIFFYEQANERFKFYEHSIDFNADRGIYINDDETYIGHGAGDSITSGANNTFIGHDAGNLNTSGHSNTANGDRSLYSNTTGCSNTVIGTNAQQENTITNVTCVGYEAGKNNTQSSIIAIGYQALLNNTGLYNTAVGIYALGNNDADNNTAVGCRALTSNTTGHRNSALGRCAMETNTIGFRNAAVGQYALGYNTEGNYNAALGCVSLLQNTTGSSNTAVGYNAGGSSTTVDGGIYLGYNAGSSNTTANRLYINNSNSAYPLIYGDFANDKVKFGDNNAYWFAQILHENSGGQLFLKECTTPTAQVNYGAIYTKNDNKLYFQDGAGNEHEVTIS